MTRLRFSWECEWLERKTEHKMEFKKELRPVLSMKGETLWKEILGITREEELPGARERMDVDCEG